MGLTPSDAKEFLGPSRSDNSRDTITAKFQDSFSQADKIAKQLASRGNGAKKTDAFGNKIISAKALKKARTDPFQTQQFDGLTQFEKLNGYEELGLKGIYSKRDKL